MNVSGTSSFRRFRPPAARSAGTRLPSGAWLPPPTPAGGPGGRGPTGTDSGLLIAARVSEACPPADRRRRRRGRRHGTSIMIVGPRAALGGTVRVNLKLTRSFNLRSQLNLQRSTVHYVAFKSELPLGRPSASAGLRVSRPCSPFGAALTGSRSARPRRRPHQPRLWGWLSLGDIPATEESDSLGKLEFSESGVDDVYTICHRLVPIQTYIKKVRSEGSGSTFSLTVANSAGNTSIIRSILLSVMQRSLESLLPSRCKLCRVCESACPSYSNECEICSESFEIIGLEEHYGILMGRAPEIIRRNVPKLAPKQISTMSCRNESKGNSVPDSTPRSAMTRQLCTWTTKIIRIRSVSGKSDSEFHNGIARSIEYY